MIPLRAQIVAILIAIAIFSFILDLVRRKKLKEEYSFLWLLMAVLLVIFAAWSKALIWITHLIGASSANSVIFFFGFVFVLLVLLHFSVKLSKSNEENKNMAQKIALLEAKIEDLMEKREKKTNA